MIKRLIASIALVAPAALFAQVIDPSLGRLEILGTSRPACVLGTPPPAVGSNMAFAATSNRAGDLRLNEFLDVNAQSRGGSINLAIPVICNSPHRVTVQSANGGLRRLGAPIQPGPFRELVPYRVDGSWGNQQASAETGAGQWVIDTAEARAGTLSLTINVPPGGQPAVSGRYSDQIIVVLQAAN